jgi:hypothetical protein
MTFKQAAFDKKASSMYLLGIALIVADVELGQRCREAGRCQEGNPLLGSGSRKMQYSIRLPALGVSWWADAMLRKGDKRVHMGGMKHWYVFPLVLQVGTTIGIISGLANR